MGCGASSSVSSASSPAATGSAGPSNRGRQPPLVAKPLVKAQPFRHGSPMTQGELNNLRNDFWSSRVEGNTHMWQALRTAAEAMLGDDLLLANAVMEVSYYLFKCIVQHVITLLSLSFLFL